MAAAVPLLIQVGIAAGASIASSMLAPKPKLNPVDKGRFDDIRFTTAEEGAFIPLCFGQRVRLAGNVIWGTATQEYVTHDPGRTGGKGGGGGGQQATPPTNTFSYKKSFAIMVCGTPVRSYRRISENLEAIYNNLGSELREDFYEAENHLVAGGAVVVTDGDCSGGRAVRLSGSGHYVELEASALFAGLHTVSVFYKATSSAQVYLSANGGAETSLSLAATGDIPASVSATLSLQRGLNTIKLRRSTGTSDVDRIYVSGTGVTPDPFEPPDPKSPWNREVTNLIDPGAAYPGDPDNPTPYYNTVQTFDGSGYLEGVTTAAGQARFELFAGVEAQPQSAIIVAVEGADETPGFRDVSYFATEDYLVKEGQLGNFVFEIEPEIQDLDDALLYLYALDGKVSAADCDFSLLAGRKISGLILDHRAPLTEWVTALESWFNFDIVPRGGKITAIPRGGAVVTRLYERELRAHLSGEERPRAAVKVTHETTLDLPGAVDVVYLDSAPSKDFHTGNQPAEKLVGFAFDRETLTFPIVSDANTAHAVGLRFLDALHLAAKPASLVCGFGKRHLIPTDIVEVEMEDTTLYTYRLTQKQADLQGMVRFSAVPERPSIYGQGGAGVSGRGGDLLIIRGLANTLLVVADCVPVRQGDFGRLVVYAAGCPRGGGPWPGYHLNKRDQNSEYERVGGYEDAATIGVVETASNSTARTGYETTRSFVVKLYSGSLESRTADELRGARVNLALYGNGSRWEVLQFVSVTPQTTAAPYVAQYLVTGVFTGIYGTEQNADAHQDGDYFILVDGALKSIPVPSSDLNRELTFVGQTAGQALADAEAVSSYVLTLSGASLKPLAPAHPRTFKDIVSTYFTTWTRQGRNAGEFRDFAADTPIVEEREQYGVEVFTPALDFVKRVVIDPHAPHPPGLHVDGGVQLSGNSIVSDPTSGGVGWTAHPVYVPESAGDYFVEASFRHNGTFTEYFGLSTTPPAEAAGARPVCDFEVQIVNAVGGAQLKVYEQGSLVLTDMIWNNTTYTPRVRFRVRNGRVSVSRVLDASTGFAEASLYEFAAAPGTLYAYFDVAGGSYAADVQVLDHAPTFVYTGAELVKDIGSYQTTLYLRIYLLSNLVGRGFPLDVIVDSTTLTVGTAGECKVTETKFIV